MSEPARIAMALEMGELVSIINDPKRKVSHAALHRPGAGRYVALCFAKSLPDHVGKSKAWPPRGKPTCRRCLWYLSDEGRS
jgi:hypothetical protein